MEAGQIVPSLEERFDIANLTVSLEKRKISGSLSEPPDALRRVKLKLFSLYRQRGQDARGDVTTMGRHRNLSTAPDFPAAS
jgi:hypothetical protein